jgi:hypothetical protein
MKTGAREAKNAYLAIAKEIPEDKRAAVKKEQERVRQPLAEKGMVAYGAEIKARQELDKAVTGQDRERTHQRSTGHER